jgi:hypothetical protein
MNDTVSIFIEKNYKLNPKLFRMATLIHIIMGMLIIGISLVIK